MIIFLQLQQNWITLNEKLLGSFGIVGQAVIQIGDTPAGLKYQPGYIRQLGEIDFIHSISGPVVVHMNTIEVKNDGNVVLGVIPMVRAVIDALGIFRIIVIVIEIQLL